MARRTVNLADQVVWIADDDPLLPELGWWAVLRTRAVDEITDQPPHVPSRISSATPRVVPRVSDDGVCGLVARPRDASTALVTPGALRATIHVDGYLPQVLDAAIDAARRQLPGGAGAGSTLLTIAPAETAPRPQFHPGRGVMLERTALAEPEQFTLHDDPAAAPALNQVPLTDGVQPPRAINAHVAGVPVVLPDQRLHRAEPVQIRGRALRQVTPVSAPIAAPGAQIGMRGLWWTQREVVANSVPPHPARLVTFAAPLAFAHDPGASVEQVALAPDGTSRRCRARAFDDDREIDVHPWTLLNPAGGDVLQIEADNSSERELVVTAGFDATIDANMPAQVQLITPLAFPHAPSAPITRMALTPAPLGALERDAVAGDRVLFLTAMAGLATDDVLRIGAATPTAELRFVRCMPAYDGVAFSHQMPLATDGTFELPPVARVAQIQFFIEHAGYPPQLPFEFVPDHDGDNALRVLFTP